MSTRLAVVLLSGGLDSATVMAIARERGHDCIALSFSYGQRHRAELDAAGRVAEALRAAMHRVVELDPGAFSGSALTDADIEVPTVAGEGIPATYVPARNTIMLAHALGIAESAGAHDIFIGVNAVDYSGYPDCRPEFIAAFEQVARLGTRVGVEGGGIHIHAPLIGMSKAAIIHEGTRLGVDFALTVSCYRADASGRACGSCDACRLRLAGFDAAGMKDPAPYCN